jgi:membrane associated rhomboid family serine protease
MATYGTKKRDRPILEPPKPVVTIGLNFLCIIAYSQMMTQRLLYVKNNSFCPGKLFYLLDDNKLIDALYMMFSATFTQINVWQLLASMYFIWVFGSTIETRLGNGRYLVLILVSMFAGWALVGYHGRGASLCFYVGPAFLISALIGAFLMCTPEKKISPGGSMFERKYQIFKNEPDPNPSDEFTVNPWVLIVAFIATQGIFHYVMTQMGLGFDSISIIPALESAVIGLLLAVLLVYMATSSIVANPMKGLAIKQYKELRALDMTHNEAIDGTSRMLTVPVEKVQEWIKSGASTLPQQ